MTRTMLVQLTHPVGTHPEGTVLDLDHGSARKLIDLGRAVVAQKDTLAQVHGPAATYRRDDAPPRRSGYGY